MIKNYHPLVANEILSRHEQTLVIIKVLLNDKNLKGVKTILQLLERNIKRLES